MTKRLWDKGEKVDSLVHRFTVGSDPVFDKNLVCHDAIGSAAHARMLESIGLLSNEEVVSLLRELSLIFDAGQRGQFEISYELEDVHTAIESHLVSELGEPGKKIHTGRSRNDQVILAMRLYLRSQVVSLFESLGQWGVTITERYGEVGDVPMPGYTHMQPAMPSSVGMWLHALLEGNLFLMRGAKELLAVLDVNPLGSAAGFGVPLPLSREFVGKLLNFSRVQRSVIDVQNSRGRYEVKVLNWCVEIAAHFEKLAWDVILYSSREFGFFTLPEEFTTGSSIMPQKHNPDVLELVRARAARVRASVTELENVISKLPSNYHRDFQYTKEPVFRAVSDVFDVVEVATRVIGALQVNREVLESAMYPDIYATYEAYRHVRDGKAFRDAYKLTAKKAQANRIERSDYDDDFQIIADSTKRYVAEASHELHELIDFSRSESSQLSEVERRVFSLE